jgi:DNA invertase Pin-like site-specific DNA recombinase
MQVTVSPDRANPKKEGAAARAGSGRPSETCWQDGRYPPVVPRIPDPPDPFDTRRAIELYRRLGSYAAVARELGVGKATAARHLKEAGYLPPKALVRDLKTLRLFEIWRKMRSRCRNPNDRRYPHHGALGIDVCPHWDRLEHFLLWARAGGWKHGMVLQRIDETQDYSPRNCRWVPRDEAQRRRGAGARMRLLRAFGDEQCVQDWARDPRCRVNENTFRSRIRARWSAEDALSLPPGSRPKKRVRRTFAPPSPARSVDWKEVERLVLQEGHTRVDAARRFGITENTVCRHFQSIGMPGRKDDGGLRVRLSALYRTWTTMRRTRRVGRPGERRRPRIDPAWEDFPTFAAWARSAGYRKGRCLICVDPDGDFTPDNCRFVRRTEMWRHQRAPDVEHRPHWVVTAWGETKGPTAWSRDKRCEVSLATLIKRLRAGWRPKDAIDTPGRTIAKSNPNQILVTAFGETKNLAQWARDDRCGVKATTVRARLRRGFPPEEAITAPEWVLGRTPEATASSGKRAPRRRRRHA